MSRQVNAAYLIHHTASLLERSAEQLLQDRFKIGFSQFKILMALKWKTDVQQRQIAESLGQTEASISRQMKALHGRGLLVNRASPGNRRQHITALTEAGNEMAESSMRELKRLQQKVFKDLSQSRQQELAAMLRTIHDQLCPSGDICSPH